MNVLEKFLKYISYESTSIEDVEEIPTSKLEFTMAEVLKEELISIGVKDAFVDEHSFVIGHIPASKGYENKKKIGFIAHLDTSPSFCGKDIHPNIIENYDGNPIKLKHNNLVIDESINPLLKKMKGRTIVTTDGSTLLGADDKAGVAEIMSAMEDIIKSGIPHTQISVAFTPDEEVGIGSMLFPLKEFDADIAYTVDGGDECEVENETFNGYGAEIKIQGKSVHPGYAKGIMKNAVLIACEFAEMLPENERPDTTEGREGYYHLLSINGDEESAVMRYILRDFEKDGIEARVKKIEDITELLNEKYGQGTVETKTQHSYDNMKEVLDAYPYSVDYAIEAMKRSGIEPKLVPIRGGTDGCRLCFMGLPCPNIATGGYSYHGPYEHISLEGMEKSVSVIKNLVDIYSIEE